MNRKQEYLKHVSIGIIGPSKACIKRAIDSMFEPNPHYYQIRGEVNKKMAIDFRKEWKAFRVECGRYYIVKDPGDAIVPTGTLANAMDTWMRNVVLKRERLMEIYVKERITTEIDGGNSEAHNVKIIDKRCNILICSKFINKKHFDEWCKKKGGK